MDFIIKREQLFFAGLFVYIIRNFIVLTAITIPDSALVAMMLFTLGCWLLSVMGENDKSVHIIEKIVLILLGCIEVLTADTWTFFALTVMPMASSKISMKKIVHFTFSISSVLLVSDIIFYFLNLAIGNVSITQVREVGDEVIQRHQFYFNQANVFSMYVIFTVFMYVYLQYDKIKKVKIYVLLAATGIFIYYFPNTRTVSVIVILFILVDIIKNTKLEKLILKICQYMFLICFILTLISLYLFMQNPESGIGATINGFLNGRLTMVAGALEQYDLKLLGQTIVNKSVYSQRYGYFTLYIDNFYGRLFIQYGIIPALVVLVVAFKTSKMLYEREKKIELILFSFIFIFGLSESPAIEIYPVFSWLFTRIIYQAHDKCSVEMENYKNE